MKYPADSTTELEICAFLRDYEKKFNEKDAAALAALCTEDAVQVGPEGPIVGRQAIAGSLSALFLGNDFNAFGVLVCGLRWKLMS
jgi:ketosteroid isomerase-like protein